MPGRSPSGAPRRARGFTLIEVLIAGTILFAVIAAATEAYRGSLLASDRAASTVRLLTPLPLITSAIRNTLRSQPEARVEGAAELLGVAYEFEAETARYGAPARRFDPDRGDFTSYPPRFRLYNVRLTVKAGSAERTFNYQELAWEPVAR